MKHIKPYQIFESEPIRTVFTKEQLNWLDKCVLGRWEYNPRTGLVDVKGRFDCSGQGLTDFKGIRFGVVSKDFNCKNNQLTTLEGAPQKVGESFYCHNNQLTTLEGAPQEVGWIFECKNNQLTSLEGSPQKVGGYFYCRNNKLTSLEGAPQKVGGDFYCENNQLTSLVGAPQKVGGALYSESNPVSKGTLGNIFFRMKKGKSYLQAVESLWSKIPLEDQALLYRPEFKWVSPEERRKLEAVRAYQGFKGMI